MYFYSYSYAEVMALPLRIFWLMSVSIERIRAEQDLCNLQVAVASQSTKEGFQKVWKNLSDRMGKVQEVDAKWAEENAEKDEAGIAELKRMFGKRAK